MINRISPKLVMGFAAFSFAAVPIANNGLLYAQSGPAPVTHISAEGVRIESTPADTQISADQVDKAVYMYDLTINNVSSSQPLAPGIYVIHDDSASLNFDGQLSPAAFESLAEIGSPTAAAELVRTLPGVMEVIVLDAPVLPGESYTLSVSAPEGYLLSGLQMPVGTNDGLSLVDSVLLDGTSKSATAQNFDNGTEENSPLLSGFEGGQPDPSRGEENVDNGTATDPQGAFVAHPQLTETVLHIDITAHEKNTTEKLAYDLTINNVSSSQPLAPGIYVIHDDSASLNFDGQLSPAAFESLAEIGSPTAAAELVRTLPGVMEVIVLDAPVLPGSSLTFGIMAPNGYLLSGLQMPVGTNDGLSLIDSVALNGSAILVDAQNFDNGTEENSPLLSGFEGGQPDPSRGEENVDNGTATDPQGAFVAHPQLTETVLHAEIAPVASQDKEEEEVDEEQEADNSIVACTFVAYDRNNMAHAITDGQNVNLYTNVGLKVDSNTAVTYDWYADYDGDNIDPVLQQEVHGDKWSYTAWNHGAFEFAAHVTDANGNQTSCNITVNVDAHVDAASTEANC